MCHNKAGPALHHLCKCLLNVHLCSGINGGCSLIQNQHGRQAEHNPGNTQKLLLPLGQPAAVLCDLCVIALGKTFDKTVRMGGFGCGFDLFLRGVRFAHCDIIPDGACSEPGILKHHSIGPPQAFSGNTADIPAADTDTAAVHIIKTHQQIDDSSLSAAGGSHNCHSLPRLHMEIKILHQLYLR